MIFIPHNVPSLKNGKKPVTINGRTVLVPSDSVKKYLKLHGIKEYSSRGVTGYVRRPNTFAAAVDGLKVDQYPVWIGFHFVRDSKRKFDFNNATELITDLLVAHGVVEDDNMDCLLPEVLVIDGRQYTVDKNKPGVWIRIRKG